MPAFSPFDDDLTNFVAHANRDRTQELRKQIQDRIGKLKVLLERSENNKSIDVEDALYEAEKISNIRRNELQQLKQKVEENISQLKQLIERGQQIPNIALLKNDLISDSYQKEIGDLKNENHGLRERIRQLHIEMECRNKELRAKDSIIEADKNTKVTLQKQANEARKLHGEANKKIKELQSRRV